MTTERKTERALLEEPSEVTLGGKTYKVNPPSLRTLVRVSALVSELPVFDAENPFYAETLSKAKDCGKVADVFAVLILGGRHSAIPFADGLRFRLLRRRLYLNARPSEMAGAFVELINRLELDSFFGVTTSLTALNVTKRKVGN